MVGSDASKLGGRTRTTVIVATWVIAAIFTWKMLRISWSRAQTGRVSDFYYFWDAGANVLAGHAARAYTTHAIPGGFIWPLPHPPPFLLLATPLGMLPITASLMLFLAMTGLAYFLTARQPLRLVLANPTAAYNLRWGQTGFLTSAILLGGMNWLTKRPIAAGAILGLMVVKPHLGLLIPVALVAGRHLKVLAAAAASAATQALLAAIAFGPAIYVAWWKSIVFFEHSLEQHGFGWSGLSSTYAFLRWCGLNNGAAWAGQSLTAAVAALLVVQSWRRDWDCKVAMLAAATILVPPYLGANDAVMMVVPLGLLAARSPWQAAIVLALMVTPWFNPAMTDPARLPVDLSALPDATPVAAALILFFLWREQKESQSSLRMVSS